ncbi:MAG: 4Fe-4S binding protein, partial [Oscillospiraceae bacterium]|nr:4Fe-4S binding protein [Oscillospiraceae bacterium]
MAEYQHSVSLDADKCIGCTSCLRQCPTEAIRIRDGRAKIRAELCIDCGNCIRVCQHKAKQAVFDRLEDIDPKFKWRIVLPAPSLYGQFDELKDVGCLL